MSQRLSQSPPSIAILVDDGSNPFEFACACEVFAARRRTEIGFELYATRLVTATRSVRVRDGLFTISGAAGLSELDTAHTIVVPNRPETHTSNRRSVLAALVQAHQRGARLVGLCTGAYTLAEAGLLDGRPATVHWQLADDFRLRFPDVDLRPNELFVDDGDLLTSAGSAAALDLALHIVRSDYGAHIANFVSRRLVFAGFRDGGQQQFIDTPVPATGRAPLSETLQWARERLDQQVSVSDLAHHAASSTATLHRRFRRQLGTTPLAWLNAERVHLALRLLESEQAPMTEIARRTGLGTTAHLRARVKQHTGLSPNAYRKHWATPTRNPI